MGMVRNSDCDPQTQLSKTNGCKLVRSRGYSSHSYVQCIAGTVEAVISNGRCSCKQHKNWILYAYTLCAYCWIGHVSE